MAPFARSRPTPRRGLRRTEAADYVGVSPGKFDQLVADRRMPAPRLIDGCVIWDVRDLDAAFDDLPIRGQSLGSRDPQSPDAPDPWGDVHV